MSADEDKASANGEPTAEINMSSIRVGGGIAGLIFAAGTVCIFVVGIPAVRGFFIGSLIVGGLISLGLHLFHKHKPASPGGNLNLRVETTRPASTAGNVRRFRASTRLRWMLHPSLSR